MKIQNYYEGMWERKIPQILFYIGLTIELVMVIIDKSRYINPIEGQLFRITFLFFACKLLSTKYSAKEWVCILLLETVAFISYRVCGKNDLIRLVTFVAACKGMDLKRVLRYTFYVTLLGCLAIILLAVTGIYGEMTSTQVFGHVGRDELDAARYYTGEPVYETRYTLGMGHPNALSCMFFMLVALGIYAWFERMKWYDYLFIMLLNIGVYALTDSRTGLLITSLFLAGACAVTYSKLLREKIFIYICGLLVFVLCIGFSVDAAVCAQRVRDLQWNDYFLGRHEDNRHIEILSKIDESLTGRIVSLTDSERNDGMIETWSAFSCPENMDYYFDMGWVKVFYRYGIVPGILYLVVHLILLWRLYKNRDACGLVLFTAFAVYTVIEAHLISVYLGRNYLLIIMGYYLLQTDRNSLGNISLKGV
ncbi:MAG: hypothetical protein J1F42_01015 [Lachnospiraceae bacterium]|nr:hypothetical protein [Lachnospiraceae bacterium]